MSGTGATSVRSAPAGVRPPISVKPHISVSLLSVNVVLPDLTAQPRQETTGDNLPDRESLSHGFTELKGKMGGWTAGLRYGDAVQMFV